MLHSQLINLSAMSFLSIYKRTSHIYHANVFIQRLHSNSSCFGATYVYTGGTYAEYKVHP